jgi:hypothetical protein
MKLKRIAALAVLALAVLALAAGLVLAACGDDDSGGGAYGGGNAQTQTRDEQAPPPKPAVETIVVRGGAPVGGSAELEFDAGEEVRFRVRSDTADEVHVHGYGTTQEVAAGGTTTISFPADIEGIFEVELHESGEQIAELRVEP